MSLRKMLKVSLLMLLAMALAATSAHARLDLFGQLLASKNDQPKPNSVVTGDDKQVVLWTKAKLDSIPYEECIKTCKLGLCACTLPWPPESAICVCVLPIKPEAAGKAIPTDQQVAKVKSEILPFEECQKTCKYECACTLIWPPELSTCVCGAPFKSLTTKTAEVVEESHKILDSLPKPVATSGGGFIPYPECIEKCDECVICTKNLPIEKSWCYCGKNTASNSNKPAIKNLGDDKKVVLWTQAKLDPIPYEECIQTCEGYCACNVPRPPISPTCICIPIAAGRALPI